MLRLAITSLSLFFILTQAQLPDTDDAPLVFEFAAPFPCNSQTGCSSDATACGAGFECVAYLSVCGTWAGHENWCCLQAARVNVTCEPYASYLKDIDLPTVGTAAVGATRDSGCSDGSVEITGQFANSTDPNAFFHCCPEDEDGLVLDDNYFLTPQMARCVPRIGGSSSSSPSSSGSMPSATMGSSPSGTMGSSGSPTPSKNAAGKLQVEFTLGPLVLFMLFPFM